VTSRASASRAHAEVRRPFAAMIASVVVACGAMPLVDPPQRFAPPARIDHAPAAPALADLDAYLHDQFDRQAPGLVVGVVSRERLVWSRAFGVRDLDSREPVDEDTIFRVGSLTKTLTGLAVLELRDEGKLSLDAPAARYLPELAGVLYPTKDSAPLTLRNLLTHTSGLSRDGELPRLRASGHAPAEAELLGSLDGQPLDYAPGAEAAYSNQAAALTGLIVARTAGVPYPEFVQTHLLRPLRMTSSGYVVDPAWGSRVATGYRAKEGGWERAEVTPPGPTQAGGHLWSSVRDLSRFVAFELSAWPPRDDPEMGPVRRSTVRESQLVLGMQGPMPTSRGAFWGVENDCALGHLVFHEGEIDGFHAAVYFAPRVGLGIIALANAREPEGLEAMVRHGLVIVASAGEPPSTVDGGEATHCQR
jgi:CubicO group peptidase (beta-lactamase class C family)